MGIESLLGVGAGLVGNIFGSNAASSAASTAQGAQLAAIQEALARAQTGYDTNKSTLAGTGTASAYDLAHGYVGARTALDPMISAGNKARGYYADATGINGEDAQSAYMRQLMARPEYKAANGQAQQQVMQQYGAKQGSGALARALQTRQTQFAAQAKDQDLKQVEPLVKAGDTGSALSASNEQQFGTNMAASDWKTGNAFVGNENQLTNEYMQGALAKGNVNATAATTQGQIDQNAFANIGNTVGRVLGGVNGSSSFSAIS